MYGCVLYVWVYNNHVYIYIILIFPKLHKSYSSTTGHPVPFLSDHVYFSHPNSHPSSWLHAAASWNLQFRTSVKGEKQARTSLPLCAMASPLMYKDTCTFSAVASERRNQTSPDLKGFPRKDWPISILYAKRSEKRAGWIGTFAPPKPSKSRSAESSANHSLLHKHRHACETIQTSWGIIPEMSTGPESWESGKRFGISISRSVFFYCGVVCGEPKSGLGRKRNIVPSKTDSRNAVFKTMLGIGFLEVSFFCGEKSSCHELLNLEFVVCMWCIYIQVHIDIWYIYIYMIMIDCMLISSVSYSFRTAFFPGLAWLGLW